MHASKVLNTLTALFVFCSSWALAAAPSATTTAASSITTTSALLNGTGTPAGEPTTGWFRISSTDPGACDDTFGARVPATGGTDLGAGAAAVPYSITTTGLVSGTTYYFCAVVQNASGTAFGTVLSFTVPAAPVVVTDAATAVTSSGVTLNGTANPLGSSTTGWFRYATTDPGTCNDSFGTRTPTSGGTSLGSGATPVPFSRALTGLLPGVTYYACAIAQNGYGTSFGAVVPFTTLPVAPTTATSSPSTVTSGGATFNGTTNPGGAATTGWFRYATTSPGACNDTFGSRAPSSGGSAIAAGNGTVAFSQAVTGLAPSTEYAVCAISENSVGKTYGSVLTFTTAAPPTVTTQAASSLTNTSAYLNGTANPNRAATTAWFRYSATNPGTCNDTFGSRAPVSGGSSMGSGSSPQSYSQSVSNLSVGTTYYYCAIAQSSEGTAFGTVMSFTTLDVPTATTTATTAITSTSVTLNGTGDPNGASATGWFRYASTNPGTCNDSFGTRAPTSGGSSLGTGTDSVPFSRSITSLTPGATYYACAVVQNAYGTAFGAVVSFTTLPAAPTVSTSSTTLITGTTATLNASANPGGAATTGWFRYDIVSPGTCNDTFGTRAPASSGASLGSAYGSVAYSQAVTSLTPGATYYVCAIVENSVGKAWGSVVTFTTPLPPVATTQAATSVANTSAYLNGTGNPNRATTTGWFRYGTTDPGTCSDSFGSRAPASGGTNLGSSTSPVAYSQYVSGLSPDTTYWFCAVAQSSEGTAFGTVESFRTPTAPTATTTATTSITATSATLNGTGDPNLGTATGWFRHGTTNPGTCSDSFGTRAPSSGGSNLGAGTDSVDFSRSITGLTPGAVYYACSVVQNAYGTAFGAVVSFTTLPTAPTATTGSASLVTSETATLNGSANTGGAATTAWFRYDTTSPGACNDTFGTRAPAAGGASLGSTYTTSSYSQGVTGLEPGTTYYVCAIAENSVGKAFGTVTSFVTATPPTVTTTAATSVTNTTAYLNGTGNPNRAATTGWFRYGTTDPGTCSDSFGSRAPASGGTNLGSSTSPVAYAQYVSGLSPDTTYWFCAVAQSTEGIAFGTVESFRTPTAPTATTTAATSIAATSATLNGTGDPNLGTATGWFRYGSTDPGTCSDSFGTRAPSSGGTSLGSGTDPVPFSRSITGLTPGSTTYACAVVQNAYGTAFGAVVSFTTLPAAPTATTSSITVTSGTTATLNGSANTGGAATTGWFRYDTTSPGACNDTFGTRAPAAGGAVLGAAYANVPFSQAVTGLTPGVTYHVCAIAENSVGKAFGSVVSFTTPLPPVATTTAASSVTNTTAYLNGTGTPNRAAATGWFRYGTTDPGTCSDAFGSRAPASGGTNLGSSTNPVAYAQYVSGLSPDTTYYACAVVQSAEGTAFGAVVSFRTPTAPTATTTAATAVTATSATLNGMGDPNLGSATGWFRYATTNPGTCSDSFGTRAPTSGGSALGEGTDSVAYGRSVTGLTPGLTYYACAIVQNAYGTAFGGVVSFTTLPTAPTASTGSITAITGTTATFNGSGNTGGAATTGWFRYDTVSPGTCNDTYGTRAPTTGGVSLGTAYLTTSFSQAITGLEPGTTYHVCAITENSVGKAFGSPVSFTTALPPTVTTQAATSLTNTSAYLNGTGTPNLAATTGWFRYSATDPGTCDDVFGSRAPTSGGTNLGSSTSPVAFSQSVASLSSGVTYYYCAIAQSSEGKAFGAVMSFKTHSPPLVTTSAATAVSPTGATLNGAGVPNGASTTGWFRYGSYDPGTCSDSYGTRAPTSGGSSLGSGVDSTTFARGISGLLPGATYYTCAIASNAYGTAVGGVLSFTTPPTEPVVTTGAASAVSSTGATWTAQVNPGGASTTGWFRYDTISPGTCNDTFGTRAPTSGGSAVPAGNSTVAFSQAVTGLTPGATYHVCAIAENSVGKTWGSVVTVTIPRPPTVQTLAATPVTAGTATLNAIGNPNGNSTTGWFRYSTTDPGACTDGFGTRAPATGASSLGGGTSGVPFAQAISGLSPGTTYWFCALVNNPVGSATGEVLSFTTPAAAPSVTTIAATSVGPATATLNASANPNGSDATGWFRYATTNPGSCTDAFGTRTPATGGTDLGGGTAAVPFTAELTGLSLGQTYWYCALVSNDVGAATGSLLTFTTSAVPTVVTRAVAGLSGTGATLQATGTPNGTPTTAWFRYATTDPGACDDSFGTRTPATGGTDLGAGTAGVDYTAALTGLARGTTYHACAIAENSTGKGFGAVVTFTTPAAPTVTTAPITALTGSSVTLHGSATPRGAAATGWFRYGTSHPGTCSDSFGTRAPSSGGTSLGSGDTAVPFEQALTGLTPGQTYHACAIAQNAEGTGVGLVVSFTTPSAPTVLTLAASDGGATTVTLNGSATPNGDATEGWFRHATSDPGTCSEAFGTATDPWPLGSGTAPMAYEDTLTGLAPGTTVWFCALARNGAGTSFGELRSVTTPTVPSVATLAASAVSSTGATLEGAANPNGSATTGWFRYGTTNPGTCSDSFGTRAPAAGGTALGAGSATVPFQQVLVGLTPATTYFACALAQNAAGTVTGELVSFTTPAAPTVTTSPISGLTASAVTLNGTANPRGASATGWFRYGSAHPGTCNDSFGTRAPSSGGTALGAGTSAVPFEADVTGLAAGTTWYACAIAQNAEGTGFGAVIAFTTPAAPGVVTLAATDLGPSHATLHAQVTPNGDATEGWFRYASSDPGACSDAFGTATDPWPLGSGSEPMDLSEVLTGLPPATTWYFCALARNSAGTSSGEVLSFTTPDVPSVTTLAVTGLTSTGTTLEATASPNGAATTGWFRYASSNPGACTDAFGTRTPASGGTDLGAGTSSVPYERALTGLTPATTYWYCALAENDQGLGTGAVLSFTTPSAPLVSTGDASEVTSTSATIAGEANPLGSTTTGWFRYDSADPGVCNDSFGTRAPASGGSALGNGGASVPFTQLLTGLTPGTTWYFCAIAANASGTRFGEVHTFTTPAAPLVTTDAASAVTSTSATLNGAGTPNFAATAAWFRYGTTNPGTCSDSFGTRAPTSGSVDLGAGGSPVPFSQAVTGLQPGTTYYVCAVASSAVDVAFGSVRSFRTTSAPTVTTALPTGVSTTTATLQGLANPNGQSTTAWFRYATSDPGACDDSFGTRTPSAGGAALGAGSADVPFSQDLTGLVPETTYYACAIAQSAGGTAFGAVRSFRTSDAPSVATLAVTATSHTTALLEGTADPRGVDATGWFRYGTVHPGTCSDAFGTRAPLSGGAPLGAGTSQVPYSEAIVGLAPGTTYHACAVAGSAAGTGFGEVLSFTTPAAPTVVTLGATAVTSDGATLEGTVDPNLADTGAWFRYAATNPGACNDSFGTRAPSAAELSVGDGDGPVPVEQALTGLPPATTWHYCVIATNLAGTSFGELRTFTTAPDAPDVLTDGVSDVGTTEAVLHGTGTPNGATTVGWFRYDTVDPGACSDAFGIRVPTSGGTDLGAGLAGVPFSDILEGLTPGATYHACALAQNDHGTAYGELVTFSPGAVAPDVVTQEATDVTGTTATLAGLANPNGSAATGWFRYGDVEPVACDDAYGARAPAAGGTDLGAGTTDVTFEEDLDGLLPNATYWFCAAADNLGGADFGEALSFTTEAVPPDVTTRPVDLGVGEVVLRGGANPNGSATSGWFRVDSEEPAGCDDAFGTRVPETGATALGDGRAEVAFTEVKTELPPGTWFVCAVAENEAGVSVGEVVTFVVPDPGDEPVEPGCGCATAPGAVRTAHHAALFGLALLAAIRRRRARAD